MLRFVIGLLAVGSVYLGWQWYADKSSLAGDVRPTHNLFQNATDENAGAGVANAALAGRPLGRDSVGKGLVGKDPLATSAGARDSAAHVAAEQNGIGPGEALVRGILAGDPKALGAGFQALLDAGEPARDRLGQALEKRMSAAGDVAAQIQILGSSNAFLHSALGRKLARKVLAKIGRLDKESAIVRSTGLLELCMRGPIAKGQNDAYDLVNEIYRDHKRLVNEVAFNPSRLTKARSHKVQPGETLDGIAQKYRKEDIRVEGWTLCYVNRIGRPNRLQAGKTIKIPVEPIWVKLEKASFLMAVYIGDTIVRLYWVAHGKEGCSTPETTFRVAEKLRNPDWYAPDGHVYPFGSAKNVLGRYFVKFAHDSFSGFGAHGTANPETIRTRASLGCIRMRGADIEEFFRMVPKGSRVVVAASR